MFMALMGEGGIDNCRRVIRKIIEVLGISQNVSPGGGGG